MPISRPITASRPGVPSRVIQGFFPGGQPRLPQPAVAPSLRPVAPVQARMAAVQPPLAAGRPNPIQPASRPGFPATTPQPVLPNSQRAVAVQPFTAARATTVQPILPGRARPGAIQPFTVAKPEIPQPILPQRPTSPAIQPHADNAFALPANFTLKPRGSGQPLPEPIQKKMEAFFNTSFADVRVHVGQEAPSIGALAFTHGTDLYFAPGQYNPQSTQGQQLLGHELTHVVQQRAGRVQNPMGAGVAVVQDPALEAEAERMGQRAASAPVLIQAKQAGVGPAVTPVPGAVARPTTFAPNGAILPASPLAQESVQRKPGPILPGNRSVSGKIVTGISARAGTPILPSRPGRLTPKGVGAVSPSRGVLQMAGTKPNTTSKDGRFRIKLTSNREPFVYNERGALGLDTVLPAHRVIPIEDCTIFTDADGESGITHVRLGNMHIALTKKLAVPTASQRILLMEELGFTPPDRGDKKFVMDIKIGSYTKSGEQFELEGASGGMQVVKWLEHNYKDSPLPFARSSRWKGFDICDDAHELDFVSAYHKALRGGEGSLVWQNFDQALKKIIADLNGIIAATKSSAATFVGSSVFCVFNITNPHLTVAKLIDPDHPIIHGAADLHANLPADVMNEQAMNNLNQARPWYSFDRNWKEYKDKWKSSFDDGILAVLGYFQGYLPTKAGALALRQSDDARRVEGGLGRRMY